MTTAGIAVLGVIWFLWLQLPLPFLLGPIFLCLAFASGGTQLERMGRLGSAFRTSLGVVTGTSITPPAVAALPDLAPPGSPRR